MSSNPAPIDITGHRSKRPRILIVTPEVSYLPPGMGQLSNYISAKGGDTADVSAALINTLFEQGNDVHVALPDYRRIINQKMHPAVRRELNTLKVQRPDQRVYLAKDRGFFHLENISCDNESENLKRALFFQREIINNVLPHVQPDFIHCHDWMTGLIPAAGRMMDIPCLFTFNNLSTANCTLSFMEDIGIDAAFFWSYLFYDRYPVNYEESRDSNPVDLLLSGIFAANNVSTGSPTFLREIVENQHDWINSHLRRELYRKWKTGHAVAIPNAPDPTYNPISDRALFMRYCAKDHYAAKQHNKLFLQEKLGLLMDSRAPVFYWPSPLDPIRKGCELLANILLDFVSGFRDRNAQIVFVAEGEFKTYFKEIVASHRLHDHVSICDFEERLARQAYAASDFVLIPSLFEPCGFPQMIGPLYGALPVAYDTGALHDTLSHMDIAGNTGNGFLFSIYDPEGLFWAIKEAMAFYDLPCNEKKRQIERVMAQSMATFNQALTASRYIELYETILERPLFSDQ
jgi:starch synthase/alpha-amylase